MRKIILLCAAMLASVIMLVSFSGKNKLAPAFVKTNTGIIECAAPATLITAQAFETKYLSSRTFVRKNIDVLSSTDINSIKTGITSMKALPYTDPRSWLYQAAIHGTVMTNNLPSWNTCHKYGDAFFFLAWHRMYLYFFERILRSRSGNSRLTLPYWNYQLNPVLHSSFRSNTYGNPLYDGTRSPAINAGGALPASIMTAFATSLNYIPFYDFQTYMNSGPHGSIHTSISGNMTLVSTSALDPVFWIHHCNIDRLWEEWLRKCDGRTNPVDAAWLNKTYTFFDENGTAVSMKGSDVLKTSTQLNYQYDFPTTFKGCPASGSSGGYGRREALTVTNFPTQVEGQAATIKLSSQNTDQLEQFIRRNKSTVFNFTGNPAPDKLVLSFSGITISRMPQGVVEVYLNLPECEKPSSENRHFVGLLDLFSTEHHSNHGAEGSNETELDASWVAKAIGLSLPDLKNAQLSFVIRGNTLNGKEVMTDANFKIQQIGFSIAQLTK